MPNKTLIISFSFFLYTIFLSNFVAAKTPTPDEMFDEDRLLIVIYYFIEGRNEPEKAKPYIDRLEGLFSYYRDFSDRETEFTDVARIRAKADYYLDIEKDYFKAIKYFNEMKSYDTYNAHLGLSRVYEEMDPTKENQLMLIKILERVSQIEKLNCLSDPNFHKSLLWGCKLDEADSYQLDIAKIYATSTSPLYDLEKAEKILFEETKKGGLDLLLFAAWFYACANPSLESYNKWHQDFFKKPNKENTLPTCKIFK